MDRAPRCLAVHLPDGKAHEQAHFTGLRLAARLILDNNHGYAVLPATCGHGLKSQKVTGQWLVKSGLPPSALARTAPSGSHCGFGDGSAQVPTACRLPPRLDDGGSYPVKALLADAHMRLRVVWLLEGWQVSDALRALAMGMTLHAGEEVQEDWKQPLG